MTRTGVPIEQERRTSSVRLDIDLGEQAELTYEIHRLSRELDEAPTVIPALTHTALKGIQLFHRGESTPHAYMALEMTEVADGLPSAVISIAERQPRRAPQSYVFRPLLNYWDAVRPRRDHQPISNTTLVQVLEDQFPKGTFDTMLDSDVPEGFDIAQLLAGHLHASATTRTERRHYQAHGNRTGMDIELEDGTTIDTSEFTRDADLVVTRQNNRITQGLFVAAAATLDIGVIRKTYGYEVRETPRGLHSAGGRLYLESPTTIQQAQLDGFARKDAAENDAVDGFHRAIEDLRYAYDLSL